MSIAAGIGAVVPTATAHRPAVWLVPRKNDPRIPFAVILTAYAILGCTLLGFNRTPLQL